MGRGFGRRPLLGGRPGCGSSAKPVREFVLTDKHANRGEDVAEAGERGLRSRVAPQCRRITPPWRMSPCWFHDGGQQTCASRGGGPFPIGPTTRSFAGCQVHRRGGGDVRQNRGGRRAGPMEGRGDRRRSLFFKGRGSSPSGRSTQNAQLSRLILTGRSGGCPPARDLRGSSTPDGRAGGFSGPPKDRSRRDRSSSPGQPSTPAGRSAGWRRATRTWRIGDFF